MMKTIINIFFISFLIVFYINVFALDNQINKEEFLKNKYIFENNYNFKNFSYTMKVIIKNEKGDKKVEYKTCKKQVKNGVENKISNDGKDLCDIFSIGYIYSLPDKSYYDELDIINSITFNKKYNTPKDVNIYIFGGTIELNFTNIILSKEDVIKYKQVVDNKKDLVEINDKLNKETNSLLKKKVDICNLISNSNINNYKIIGLYYIGKGNKKYNLFTLASFKKQLKEVCELDVKKIFYDLINDKTKFFDIQKRDYESSYEVYIVDGKKILIENGKTRDFIIKVEKLLDSVYLKFDFDYNNNLLKTIYSSFDGEKYYYNFNYFNYEVSFNKNYKEYLHQYVNSKRKLKKTKFKNFVFKFDKLSSKIPNKKLLIMDDRLFKILGKIQNNKKYEDILNYLEAKIKLEEIKRGLTK